jgi:hypothetical protein
MSDNLKFVKGKVVYSPFRSLENYKEMHKKTAESKGVASALAQAKTLTQARIILFGKKRGQR